MTEYELCDILEGIVNKYEHLIDKLASVRFMVDCQFETTKRWIYFQLFVYICGFQLPNLLQLFVFNDAPETVYMCNLLTLITAYFFMGLEII